MQFDQLISGNRAATDEGAHKLRRVCAATLRGDATKKISMR
jgi:hypothetical protein